MIVRLIYVTDAIRENGEGAWDIDLRPLSEDPTADGTEFIVTSTDQAFVDALRLSRLVVVDIAPGRIEVMPSESRS